MTQAASAVAYECKVKSGKDSDELSIPSPEKNEHEDLREAITVIASAMKRSRMNCQALGIVPPQRPALYDDQGQKSHL